MNEKGERRNSKRLYMKERECYKDFIGQFNLKVENQGKTPTFQAAVGNSIIDVTLTSRLSVTVKKWRLSTIPNFSDHKTINMI